MSPDIALYGAGALMTAVVGYAAKRIVESADRIDLILVKQENHDVRIAQINEALGRGRVRFEDIDKHLQNTDKNVHDAHLAIARMQGKV
jgi:ActR/RegA family two-component response regulator